MLPLRRVAAWPLVLSTIAGLAAASWFWWKYTAGPDYLLRHGQEALRHGQWDEAERFALRLEAGGHSNHAHVLRGEIFLHRQDLARAVEEYNQIRDEGDLLVDASAIYGEWFLLHLNRPVEAERFLRFVVSRRPDHVVAHRGLATIYYDQRAWVPAVLHLIEWGNLDRRDGRPYRFMGLIYKDLDQPQVAIRCYEEALRRQLKDHVFEEVREELAECLVAQSQYEQALQTLEDCGARATENARLLALRGECLWGLGRVSEARQLLDQALNEQGPALELLRIRAKIYLEAKEPSKAVPLLERAIEIDPQDYSSRHQLALAYQSTGRSADAAEQRRLAQKTQDALLEMTKLIQEAGEKPWDASIRKRLAEMCEKLNKLDLADKWRQAAATCPPAAVSSEAVNEEKFPGAR